MDHSQSLVDVLNAGIPIFANSHTYKTHGVDVDYSITKFFDQPSRFKLNSESDWSVMTFPLTHDVPICGFLIHHPECGKVLFATDTSEILYSFPSVDNIIIEANYSEEILSKLDAHSRNEYLSYRVRNSHLSIEKAIEFLKKTDLQNVKNIVLIHLSDRNSHEKQFKSLCRKQLGKPVIIANNGLEIDFNENIFDCF
jgi:ribonuclease BN (tRNA processing enzyme)